ncbi:MAG: NUDIX domain-containing protein [Bdellovibrionales bacterium]|nr:NUDIX domain-containing protein [Bdellovibrionales bacterium]
MARARKALTVITWNGRNVLVLRRGPELGGEWQAVTGKVEAGEDFMDAARREAEEETGFSFSTPPRDLGLEQEFEGRWGPAVERAFHLSVAGAHAPLPTLDPREHVAFEWLPFEEAMRRVQFPFHREAIFRATHPFPPLRLDAHGRFHQEGEEITHERTVDLLHNSLKENPDGSWRVQVGTDSLPVEVEDVPFFARSFEAETGLLTLLGGRREALRPETLELRPPNGAYALLQNGARVKLQSPAYYAVMSLVREEEPPSKKYVLHLFGRDYELRVPK